ncbi:hypothetical protein U14_01603 [Candidatus Moduliflexus flocculans]|uniref:Uncharacterized protein n=1 Tax=Candidatus Moduliflexus flocculans TaxID=1499966 RepID=A0A0S6VSI7_9BACT|nr:hypothetical protein U14_01603 [Candidatus Moduliflexus flocculans]
MPKPKRFYWRSMAGNSTCELLKSVQMMKMRLTRVQSFPS